MRKLVSIIGIILMCGCASTQQECSHTKSDIMGLERKVTLYANDGTVIKTWQFKGTVEDQGGSFRFLVDGKAQTISGTIVIEEI